MVALDFSRFGTPVEPEPAAPPDFSAFGTPVSEAISGPTEEPAFVPAYPGDVPAEAWTAPKPADMKPFDPARPEETWGEAGKKLIENVGPAFRQFGGGLLRKLGEMEPQPPAGMDPNDPQWQSAVRAFREAAASPSNPLATKGREIYAAATAELQANQPNIDPESLKGYAYDIAGAMIQMVPSIAVSVATRRPILGLAEMGGQVYGQEYGEARAAGRSPEQASMDAAFYTLAETIPERIPLGIITKEGGRFLPRVLKAAGAEGVQEQFTEALRIGYETGVLGKNEDMTWGEAWARLKRAGIVGAGMGGGLATVTHPFVRERPPAPPGEREKAAAAPVTPGDEASPIPTDLIAEGKKVLADVDAVKAADAILARNGFPATETSVTVTWPDGRTAAGTVADAFTEVNAELGLTGEGVKIRMADGSMLEEFFPDLARAGVRVAPVAAAPIPAPPVAPPGAAARPPGPPAAPAAPIQPPLAPAAPGLTAAPTIQEPPDDSQGRQPARRPLGEGQEPRQVPVEGAGPEAARPGGVVQAPPAPTPERPAQLVESKAQAALKAKIAAQRRAAAGAATYKGIPVDKPAKDLTDEEVATIAKPDPVGIEKRNAELAQYQDDPRFYVPAVNEKGQRIGIGGLAGVQTDFKLVRDYLRDGTLSERGQRIQDLADRLTEKLKARGIEPRNTVKMAAGVLFAAESGRYNDWISPANKSTRALFEEITGVKLPKTIRDTKALFGKPFLEEDGTRIGAPEVAPPAKPAPQRPGKDVASGMRRLASGEEVSYTVRQQRGGEGDPQGYGYRAYVTSQSGGFLSVDRGSFNADNALAAALDDFAEARKKQPAPAPEMKPAPAPAGEQDLNALFADLMAEGVKPAPAAVSYRPQVKIAGKWEEGNALRFATMEEAQANAEELMSRWYAVQEVRVGKSTDPVNSAWREGKLVDIQAAVDIDKHLPMTEEAQADIDRLQTEVAALEGTRKTAETEPPTSEAPVATDKNARLIALADRIAERLADPERLTILGLQKMADDAMGGTLASGAYDRKDMYDALELGVNKLIRARDRFNDPTVEIDAAKQTQRNLRALVESLPSQTVRSEEQLRFQQFSTPPDYAFAVAWAANIGRADVVLEPSAGTGSIAVFAANARPVEIVTNELSERRAVLLRSLDLGRVFTENAEQLNNVLPEDVRPTVVVMNPPFSQTAGRLGDKKMIETGAVHIEQALKRLAPGGRLVAIAGRGMGMDAPRSRDWWAKISKDYNVRANIEVAGPVYAKHGTTFETRLLVIDKVTPGPESAIIQGQAETVSKLLERLHEVRNDRRQPETDRRGEREPAQPGGAQVVAAGGTEQPGGREPARPRPGVVGAGEGRAGTGAGRGPEREPQRGRRPDVREEPGRPAPLAGEQSERTGRPARAEPEPAAGAPRGEQPGERGGIGARGAGEPARGAEPVLPARAERVGVEDAGRAERLAGEFTDSVYEPYAPQRLVVKGAQPHPGPLVQSAAMASVASPKPTYSPAIPKNLIERGALSIAQIEAIVYAGQAHEKMLPAAEGEPARRRGFFIGDGTGVGKGREVAGIILDNFNQGRIKAIWITEKKTLIEDARRDWSGLSQDANAIFDLGKTKNGQAVKATRGILFSTYDTLKQGLSDQKKLATGAGFIRGQAVTVNTPTGEQPGTIASGKPLGTTSAPLYRVTLEDGSEVQARPNEIATAGKADVATRVQQVVDWVGKDFEGVVAFDESHNMANAIQQKGTRGLKEAAAKALAGIELQRALPNARIVYVSATGATEVSNLAYAERLGLWGRGMPFASMADFVADIEEGGIAAMELVARDLKALGSYIARGLSYDGVEYDRVEHVLSAPQREIYDSLAEAWQLVLRNINKALELTGAVNEDTGKTQNAQAKSAAMSAFWGAHQRFFNQIITSMQMPSVLKAVEADVAAGRQAVLQIVNTNEASQERAAAKIETAEDIEDLDITPRDQLIQLVEHSFPTQQYEQYEDDNGNIRARPVVDSAGRPVENVEAVALRDALVDRIASVKVPQGPLEMLLDRFGVDTVAEVTGRKRRFVMKRDDKTGEMRRLEDVRPGSANLSETAAFQSGKKKVLIFSDAGGTGRSYHADNGAPSRDARRVHYLVQAGWRADKAIQGFGRTHRTDQASAPIVRLVTTDLKGQKRFISSVARRLGQLGALTKGQRQTGDQGVFTARDNIEGREAREALHQFFNDLAAGRVEDVAMGDFEQQTGLRLTDPVDGGLLDDLPPIQQFLNRLLSLKIDMQDKVFDAFERRLEAVIEAKREAGLLDVGLETIRADRIVKESEQTVHTDADSGAETRHVEITLSNRPRPRGFKAATDSFGPRFLFWAKSPKGHVYVVSATHDRTDRDGTIVGQYRLTDPLHSRTIDRENIDGEDSKWERIERRDAESSWNAQVAKLPEFVDEDMHLITGAVLPIWDRLKGHPRIVRLQTDAGERLLGRVVPTDRIAATLKALGAAAGKTEISAEDAVSRIMAGQTAVLANDWKIVARVVAGEQRLEVRGPSSYSEGQELIKDGAFSERIQFETRYFIPTGEGAAKVFAAITRYRPVVEMQGVARHGEEKFALPRGPVVTDTPAFKHWFGESKVVDPEGKPLVVYHGTNAPIDAFLPAAHFGTAAAANDRLRQREGAREAGGEPSSNIMPAYIRIERPLLISDQEASDEDVLVQAIRDGRYPQLSLNTAMRQGAVRAAEDAGYDGFKYINAVEDKGSTSYVAFRPEQIKSATGNRGSFDPNDKRISYALPREERRLFADARREKLRPILRRRLDAVGLKDVALRLPQVITRLADGKATPAEGRYLRRTIEIAIAIESDKPFVLDHEIVHALKDLGVLRAAEWRTLERFARGHGEMMAEIRRRYRGQNLSEAALVEEAIADAFADWADGQTRQTGFIRSAFERVRAFFKALAASFREAGYTSVEDIFEGVDKGYVGRRDAKGRFVAHPLAHVDETGPMGMSEGFMGGNVEIVEEGTREPEDEGKFALRRGEERVHVPAEIKRWLGIERDLVADYAALQAGHPEIYASADGVRQDVIFVLEKPNDWFPFSRDKVTVFREREKGAIPAVRVDLSIKAGEYRIASVYVMGRGQIAHKMKMKHRLLREAGLEDPGQGAPSPGATTVADYIHALSQPATHLKSGVTRVSDESIPRRDEEEKYALPRPPRPAGAGDRVAFDNEESEARWQEARKGAAGQETLITQMAGWWDKVAAGFTRHYIELPNAARFADVKEQLRKLEAAPQVSKERIVRYLKTLLKGMTRDDIDIFTRKVVLDDLTWEVEQEREIAFGMSAEDVAREKAKVDAVLERRPDIAQAVRQRKLIVRKVADDLVVAGVLRAEQVKNPAYYRHQVLDYARAMVQFAKGPGNKLKSPRWARRMGSQLDINANLLEAEFDWLHKALTDIETAKTISWIKASEHNVRADVIATAKAHNARLVDGMLADEGDGGPLHDAMKRFRQRIAIGLGKVRKAIEDGDLFVPEEFEDAAAQLTGEADNEASIFPFLAWIMDSDEAGAAGAAQAFKAISQRREFVRHLLGDRYADPMNVGKLVKRFAPEGYVAWQPDEGKLLYTAKSLPERVVDRVLSRIADDAGGPIPVEDLRAAMESVRSLLAVGGNKFEMVIPEELAATLNGFRDQSANDLLHYIAEAPSRSWKVWTLFNPRRVAKYNINNLSGDMDAVIAGNPKALRKMARAIKELYSVMIRGEAPSARYREAVERGVFDSGLTVQEIPDINYLAEFEGLIVKEPIVKRFTIGPLMKVWRKMRHYTQFRENWLRLAAYLDYVERLEAGESMESIGYGASKPEIVDAVPDLKDKAALLARELVGDYGNISAFGIQLRRFLIPFWSWNEINIGRYYRLTANAFGQGVGKGFATGGALGAAIGLRTTVYLFLRMAAVYAMVALWNNLMFGDDEDDLDEAARARLHLNLGRWNGERVTLRFQGALSDALSWFGFDDAIRTMLEAEKGRAGLGDILKAIAKAPVNKIVNGVTPVLKAPFEAAAGVRLFPDVFNPVPVKDAWRELFRTFSLEHEYDVAAEKPSRGYARSWAEALVNSRDVGEQAYGRAQGLTHDWLRRVKGQEGYSTFSTPRAQALHEWRRALRFGDDEAAEKAHDRMRELGIDRADEEASIKRAHPLGSIALKDRRVFLETLTERERQVLDHAINWYREVYAR